MACNISFFAIHVDDIARGMKFYQTVFHWRFEPWGPPGFYLIHTGDEKNPGILGAMHERREPREGKGLQGFECTITVDSIDETMRAIEANGGRIGMAKFTIPTVGSGCYFYDTEGNWAGAMQYETQPRA
jgi:predicted enzyme related to lactoylglutathione lyase